MLVSVITPCSRPEDLPRIKEVFMSQTYADKEMLILMDEEGWTEDTDMSNRIYQWGIPKASIATKRNHLVEHAKGEIIVTMDSDDWFAPDWITRTVDHMINTGADTTGLDTAWFYQPHSKLYQYRWNGKMPYCIGGTLAYKRSIWQNNPFRETKDGCGEDTLFMGRAGRIIPHKYLNGFVAMIHGKNTTSHTGVRTNPRFHPMHPSVMLAVLGADYNKYGLVTNP